jgi:hypothetical protein
LKDKASVIDRDLMQSIARRSRLTCIRDQITADYLAGCPMEPPVSCPSLTLLEPAQERAWGVLHADNLTLVGQAVYDRMDAEAEAFARATDRPYRKTNNRFESDSQAGLQANLSLYARSDVVLSSRLHGCILGLGHGAKVLAVSGDRKLESFMQAAGLGDWVLDRREVAALGGRLQALAGQPSVAGYIEEVRRAHRSVAASVKDLATEKQPR